MTAFPECVSIDKNKITRITKKTPITLKCTQTVLLFQALINKSQHFEGVISRNVKDLSKSCSVMFKYCDFYYDKVTACYVLLTGD